MSLQLSVSSWEQGNRHFSNFQIFNDEFFSSNISGQVKDNIPFLLWDRYQTGFGFKNDQLLTKLTKSSTNFLGINKDLAWNMAGILGKLPLSWSY